MQIRLVAQTQYDYYDDHVFIGRANRTLNEIIIIVGLFVIVFILLLFIGGILKVYYWFNPQANPEYKKMLAKEKQEKKYKEYVQEQDRKRQEYVREQRKKAIYEYVDLGLSVKWATFNLGAYKPSDVGRTFCLTEEHQAIENQHENNKTNIIGGYIRYDIATKIIGENWRLPTVEEYQELLDLCEWETKIIDNIEGRLITGPNGNSIFLPFNNKDFRTEKYVVGLYWTSSLRFKNNSFYNLRFGDVYKQPAEIWSVAPNCSLGIRPVFTTVTKEMAHRQKQMEAKNAYDKIPTTSSNYTDILTYYQEQCNIRDEEKNLSISPLYGGYFFIEEKTITDEHGVVYSLDGKRLLDGRNCNCIIYKIKEGTEFICNNAFAISLGEKIFNKRKRILEKIILPSSLLYFPESAVPENCSMESISPNYCIINSLLIDTRQKSIVKCLSKNIQQVEIYEPIESIGDDAFINCIELREVVLPNSIKKIGNNAFRNCEMLNKINLPDSINIISEYSFFNCEGLRITNLPKNLSVIGDSAFQWCIIDSIIIPKNIKEIGKVPFSKETQNISSESPRFVIDNSLLIDSDNNELIQLVDSAATRISIPKFITKIRANAFMHTDIETISMPSSIKELEYGIFWNCKKLTEIQFDCDVDRLPDSIFANCSSLISINIPKQVKIIEKGTFYQCKNLHEIVLNNGLRIIENHAFKECSNLASLNIPESVEKIGSNYEYCFEGCHNLSEIHYDASEAELTGLPHNIAKLTIGNHVKTLPKSFITYNKALEKIVIPNNVQKIEKGCIANCSNLKEISILSKNIILEEGWIHNCENLRLIRVPADIYESLLPFLPKNKKLRIKKNYAHKFLFFKW